MNMIFWRVNSLVKEKILYNASKALKPTLSTLTISLGILISLYKTCSNSENDELLIREFRVSQVKAEIIIKGSNSNISSAFRKAFYKHFKDKIIVCLTMVSIMSRTIVIFFSQYSYFFISLTSLRSHRVNKNSLRSNKSK